MVKAGRWRCSIALRIVKLSLVFMCQAVIGSSEALAAETERATEEDKTDEPVDVNAQKSIGKFPNDATVKTGDFPGSIRIPGYDASVRIGGMVELNTIHDWESLGFGETLSPGSIPIDGMPEDESSQTRLSARDSRINFDLRGKNRFGVLRMFVEADFLGSGSELSSGYSFQLRHAAAQIGGLFIGQWWSIFDDISAFPESAVPPLGAPSLRSPGLRTRYDFGNWTVGGGVETPKSDLSGPGAPLDTSESFPDTQAYLRFGTQRLHLRLAGMVRRLESEVDIEFTGAGNFSGRIPLAFLDEHDGLSFQVQYGSALGRYYLPISGAGLDAVVTNSGAIIPTEVVAGYVAVQHWWSERWRSTFVASAIELDRPETTGGSNLRSSRSYIANLYFSPIDTATFGLDLIYATREDQSGVQGDGFRTIFSARVDFWPQAQ